jgi:hypothetical protein
MNSCIECAGTAGLTTSRNGLIAIVATGAKPLIGS